MNDFIKFEGIDYTNNFAKKINSVHQLVSKNIRQFLSNGKNVIDIGGGPAVGAKIIDDLSIKTNVLNLEPSANVKEVPVFKNVKYEARQIAFVDALNETLPIKADVVLMVSAAHEIALAYIKSNEENKAQFFKDLKLLLINNTNEGAVFCIGFPNYKIGVSNGEVKQQRTFVDKLLGHSHPPQDYFYIEEFKQAYEIEPIIFEQKPMVLAHESEEETKLMANFAAFKVGDILNSG